MSLTVTNTEITEWRCEAAQEALTVVEDALQLRIEAERSRGGEFYRALLLAKQDVAAARREW
jgi:hypothetical protein